MLKFVKHHLESMSGVEIYPIVSLLLFFFVFSSMLFMVWKMPKKNLDTLSQLPLDNDKNHNENE